MGIIKNKEGPKGRTPLMYAAKTGDLAKVQFLLGKHANATKEDADLHSVLYYAAVGGNLAIIRELLEHGSELNHKNKWGNTALHYAAAYGNVNAIRILCQAGANVNEINKNENTALMQPLEPSMVRIISKPSNETKAECVRILLEAGSDVNMRNKQGSTALSLACSSGNVEAVRALCDAGSDVNTHDNDGTTPLLSLISNIPYNDTPSEVVEEIVEILLSNGANPDMADERGRILEMFIHGIIEDEELKERLLARITVARAALVPVAQGGGTRRGKKGKGKRKTRKARSSR
jgi:ankyrin repeat protein